MGTYPDNLVLDKVFGTCRKALMTEPFYAFVLTTVNKYVTDKGCATGCVYNKGLSVNMLINKNFFMELNDGVCCDTRVYDRKMDMQWGLIKHELLHVCFGHLFNYQELTRKNKDIANIAMDISINQYIEKTQLVDGACTLEYFNKKLELDMRPFESCKYYFDEIYKMIGSDSLKDLMQQMGNGESDGRENKETNQDISKSCGDNGNFSKNKENYKPMEFDPDSTPRMPEHDFKDPSGNCSNELDSSSKQILKGHLEGILKQAALQAPGEIPGEMKQIVSEILAPRKSVVDWKTYLKRFCGANESVEIKQSYRFYNKRIPENRGIRFKTTINVLAAIDTSGSVSDKIVSDYLGELSKMVNTAKVNVDLLQFDSAIQDVSKFNPDKSVSIFGRGGTDFDPPFEYYLNHKNEYDCFIVLTDGMAGEPQHKFGGARVLWIVYNECKDEMKKMMDSWVGSKVFVSEEDLEK